MTLPTPDGPFLAIVFLVPVAIAFALLPVLLDQPVFFATFLGYGTALLSILAFYFLASVWFVLRRYKYVKRGAQFTADLPRPRGY